MPESTSNDPEYVPSPKDLEEGLKPRGARSKQDSSRTENNPVTGQDESIWIIGPTVRRFRKVFRK